MNILLFKPEENPEHLPASDPRALHVREVLLMKPGDSLFVGVIDGLRGKAKILDSTDLALTLSITWEPARPSLRPLELLVGLPRPQTARKLLQEMTSLGLRALHFYQVDKGEKAYAQSTLWHSDEWQRLLIQGAEQAFCTRLPQVHHYGSLTQALEALRPPCAVALDNYESPAPLSQWQPTANAPALLIVGGERGFSAQERSALRAQKIPLHHLGTRVLRTETAAIAGAAIALSKLEAF